MFVHWCIGLVGFHCLDYVGHVDGNVWDRCLCGWHMVMRFAAHIAHADCLVPGKNDDGIAELLLGLLDGCSSADWFLWQLA